MPAPIIVLHCDTDQQKLQVPDTLMRAFVGKRQASIVGDFNVTADFQIESDPDE
jgi:hypothetical protein